MAKVRSRLAVYKSLKDFETGEGGRNRRLILSESMITSFVYVDNESLFLQSGNLEFLEAFVKNYAMQKENVLIGF